MSKINDENNIKKEAEVELGLGKIYYNSIEVDKNDFYSEEGYIFDTSSFNFHFLPKIKSENKEMWGTYIERVKEVQGKIKNKLKELKENKEICYKEIHVGYGNVSNLENYPLNGFFRYVQIKTEEGFFTINFMRWYIDREKTVNCRMGELQFDFTEDGKVNSKGKVNYPKSYQGQDINKIMINKDPESCVYNPYSCVGNIWNNNVNVDKVIDSFKNFVSQIKNIKA